MNDSSKPTTASSTTASPSTTFPSVRSLILIPAAITLAVTIARLGLELGGAPSWLANDTAGGPLALVGIVWLPILFGPYFATKLLPHAASKGAYLKRLIWTLFVYGLAARIPIVVLTVFALVGEWGTHYEKFPFEGGFASKMLVTVLAQLGLWAGVWTIVTGTLSALAFSGFRRLGTRPALESSAA